MVVVVPPRAARAVDYRLFIDGRSVLSSSQQQKKEEVEEEEDDDDDDDDDDVNISKIIIIKRNRISRR